MVDNFPFEDANLIQSGGKPYSVLVPEARYVIVPPGKYLEEVNRARESELSMYAASKQVHLTWNS